MKQKRRSFSVKGLTYQRIEDYTSTQEDLTISGFLENLIEQKLGPATPEDRKKFDAEQQKRIEEKNREPDPPSDMEDYIPPIQMF